jgi:hypothetical protein
MISLLLLAVFGGVLGATSQSGLWSNLVMLVNIILGSLIAINFWEPVAAWAGETLGTEYAYLLDSLAIWGLFGLSVGVMRAATDFLSQVKVKFLPPIDQWVGLVVGAGVAWVMVCFVSVTLHVTPVAEHFLGFEGGSKSSIFLGMLSPDQEMLSFAHLESVGAMSRSVVHMEGGVMSAPEPKEFDPKGDFITRYGARRASFEKLPSFTGPGGG